MTQQIAISATAGYQVDSLVDRASNRMLSCPFDIIDDILNQDDVVLYAKTQCYNRAYSKVLKSIGIKIQAIKAKRFNYYTIEYCNSQMEKIISMKEAGYNNSYVAVTILKDIMDSGKEDSVILFNKIEL